MFLVLVILYSHRSCGLWSESPLYLHCDVREWHRVKHSDRRPLVHLSTYSLQFSSTCEQLALSKRGLIDSPHQQWEQVLWPEQHNCLAKLAVMQAYTTFLLVDLDLQVYADSSVSKCDITGMLSCPLHFPRHKYLNCAGASSFGTQHKLCVFSVMRQNFMACISWIWCISCLHAT